MSESIQRDIAKIREDLQVFMQGLRERTADRDVISDARVSGDRLLVQGREDKFYARQTPGHTLYRDDLYRGKMGPDIQRGFDRTREEERLGALEEMRLQRHRDRTEGRTQARSRGHGYER